MIERNDQIQFSMMLTAGTVAFYWIFLSRMAKFQRFFNLKLIKPLLIRNEALAKDRHRTCFSDGDLDME